MQPHSSSDEQSSSQGSQSPISSTQKNSDLHESPQLNHNEHIPLVCSFDFAPQFYSHPQIDNQTTNSTPNLFQ